MKTKVRVAVIGASGYAGEELVRLLLAHPDAELAAVTSRQFAGKKLSEAFPRFAGVAAADALVFQDFEAAEVAREAEIVFLALPHGVLEFAQPLPERGVCVMAQGRQKPSKKSLFSRKIFLTTQFDRQHYTAVNSLRDINGVQFFYTGQGENENVGFNNLAIVPEPSVVSLLAGSSLLGHHSIYDGVVRYTSFS